MIRFITSDIAPNPKECDYWIDINENPYGGVIKYFNGSKWDYINKNTCDTYTKEQIDQKIQQAITEALSAYIQMPSGGNTGQVLKKTADGVAWQNDNNTTYSNATSSTDGLMSAEDKQKLDSLQAA